MKTILKHGNLNKFTICNWCKCEFTYELEDIYPGPTVTCPDCGNPIIIENNVSPTPINDPAFKYVDINKLKKH